MFLKQKKVLLIGGTGTIGQALLREILSQQPQVVRVFSRDEHKQYEMQNEFDKFRNIRYLLGDVRDFSRVMRAMEEIDVVFHMAALKHVPACEYNPFEAVQTNIIGTQNVITAAMQLNVERVVVTSTDKAISPTNTYGATKLVVERLVAAAEMSKGTSKTIFTAVRFGNVMGSRGSVIPLFKKQILSRRPLTVTDLSMSRFMMTLSQSVRLTLEATERAQGGELFILKMPVVRMEDLLSVLQEEMSLQHGIPLQEIGLEVIGLRPGEKMYEELMTREEAENALELENMFVIPPNKSHTYEGAKPAKQETYSSQSTEPISREKLRSWVLAENLLSLA